MYHCEECKAEFDEPKAVREYMGEFWGTPAYDTFYYCPICGSEAIEEGHLPDDEEEEDD